MPVGYTAVTFTFPFEFADADFRVQAKLNATISTNNIDSAEKVFFTPRTRSVNGFIVGVWNSYDYDRNFAIDLYVIGRWK